MSLPLAIWYYKWGCLRYAKYCGSNRCATSPADSAPSVGCSVRKGTRPLLVGGDILHSSVNNKNSNPWKAGRSGMYTGACFICLSRDIEFEWVEMKN